MTHWFYERTLIGWHLVVLICKRVCQVSAVPSTWNQHEGASAERRVQEAERRKSETEKAIDRMNLSDAL